MLLRTLIAAVYVFGAIWLVWTERATGIAGWIVLGIGLLVLLTITDNWRRMRGR